MFDCFPENATLAGGVIVGATADLMLQPYGAFCAGCVAGCISTFGYQVIQVNQETARITRFFVVSGHLLQLMKGYMRHLDWSGGGWSGGRGQGGGGLRFGGQFYREDQEFLTSCTHNRFSILFKLVRILYKISQSRILARIRC